MVDLFCLIVSMSLTALVVLRAVKLDRELEWFPRPRPPAAGKPGSEGPGAPRGADQRRRLAPRR